MTPGPDATEPALATAATDAKADGQPEHEAVTASNWEIALSARAKKAYGAGVAAAVTAAGGVSILGAVHGTTLDVPALITDAGIIVGGFVLGFAGAFFPTNAK